MKLLMRIENPTKEDRKFFRVYNAVCAVGFFLYAVCFANLLYIYLK